MADVRRKAERQLARLRADLPHESRALARRALWAAAGRLTPVLAVDREGMRFFVSTRDQVIGRRLFVYPWVPEQDIRDAFTVLHSIPAIADVLTRPVIVEIGANIGNHTVDLVRHYGFESIVAIEPAPENLELLRQNILVNGVDHQATVLPVGLSDHEGVMQLELSGQNSGDHRIRVVEPGTAGEEAGRQTVDVAVTTFDALVDRGDVDLDATGLIWMDTQGHEAHILRGAKRLLGSPIPIVTEYWPYALRRAGGLDEFHEIVADQYPYVIDLHPAGGGPPRVLPSEALPSIEAELQAVPSEHDVLATDLVLAPGIDPSWRS